MYRRPLMILCVIALVLCSIRTTFAEVAIYSGTMAGYYNHLSGGNNSNKTLGFYEIYDLEVPSTGVLYITSDRQVVVFNKTTKTYEIRSSDLLYRQTLIRSGVSRTVFTLAQTKTDAVGTMMSIFTSQGANSKLRIQKGAIDVLPSILVGVSKHIVVDDGTSIPLLSTEMYDEEDFTGTLQTALSLTSNTAQETLAQAVARVVAILSARGYTAGTP